MAGLALIVVANAPDTGCDRLARAVVKGLRPRYEPRLLDLDSLGFRLAMTGDEWKAYHTSHPILDPMVAEHAELVSRAEALVFVYPTVWWGPHPAIKAWLERVLVPGVAFVLDERHRVRPNLHRMRAIAGVTVHAQSTEEMAAAGDGGRLIVLRGLRLNVPHRLRTEWLAVEEGRPIEPFASRVEKRMARL
jgi:NAD(P)H dehydrogenase (quinone)